MGMKIMIIITCPEVAHEALVEKGTLFANRPPDTPTKMLFSADKCSINSAEYGPLWRVLRRNMVAEMLQGSRIKNFGWIRDWAIDRLVVRLEAEAGRRQGAVEVLSNIRFTIFSILLCMCFGRQLDEELITHVDQVMKDILLIVEPQIDDFLPFLTPLFVGRWKRIRDLRRVQMESILPLINKRREFLKAREVAEGDEKQGAHAYVDSLMDLKLEGRHGEKPNDEELVTLCSELLTAGTDTTATALEWALLRMVLHPDIQAKVYNEIESVVGQRKVQDTDIDNLPYLNAVVKETLRRHPPGHFVLSHAVTEDCKLRGFDIPAKANVEFYTAAMSFDPHLWPDPMIFKPERFLDPLTDVDITGNKQVKMMPFGVGRRICPALGLGTLHINLILARMVQAFHWSPRPGETPDTSEKFAFTVVVKNPLHASIRKRGTTFE
uniref:Cytochrome P450 n=1 Tax=Araucaria cunninghamii TaxID=56994 RepID=A0A0D6QWA6_ARACU